MKGLNPRVFSIMLFSLMGLSALMFLLFMFTDAVSEALLLNWCFLLLGASALAAIIFAVIGMVKDFSKARNTLIGVAALVIIFFVGFSMSGGEAYDIGERIVEGSTAKASEAGLITFYAMAIIAILAIVYTEVSKAFK